MLNEPVPAAVTGLPASVTSTPSFHEGYHLAIGRALAANCSEMERRNNLKDEYARNAHPNHSRAQAAVNHTLDRHDALVAGLAAFPCSDLAGAALHIFAAMGLFETITEVTDPSPQDERMIRRLLWSAAAELVRQTGLDPQADGLNTLMPASADPWRDV